MILKNLYFKKIPKNWDFKHDTLKFVFINLIVYVRQPLNN